MYNTIKTLIAKTGLSAEQIIYLTSLSRRDGFVSTYPKPFFKGDLRELIDRGYIVGTVETPASNVITPEGFNAIFIDEDVAANEIWNLYPSYFDKYQTKSMDKEMFIMLYQKKIDNLKDKHEEIKELLIKAIEYGWINRKIEMWIRSEQWNEWKEQLQQMKSNNDRTTEFT